MVFEEVISLLDTTQLVFVMAIFIIFLYLMKKAVKTLINVIGVAVVSGIFPFVANAIGVTVPTEPNAIIFFVAAGIGIYFIYVIGKIILAMLGFIEGTGKMIIGKK
jgi:hypothetical protein